MTSRRETALAAAFAALQALADTDENLTGKIWRNRRHPLNETEAPAIIMMDGGHDRVGDAEDTYQELIDIEFAVELAVTGDSDAAVTVAIDQYYQAVTNALVADHTLGGIADDITADGMDGPDLFDEAGARFGAEFSLRFVVRIDQNPRDVSKAAFT
ncbi:MAG TPA: hypothetical protein DFI00_06190 [Rhodospirillaceae bacterium]|nr:hypothetical protein [Alphaproteobacteria bacterium]OUT41963.1 MAG: hypothetical protein CBB62_06550 [Micavibrio sp. TMED2]HCI46864.1 hypothetical protein [Rhodospirillaceae bacterium]MAS46441.1 hypothetical protein [Alphaproteobacteria bacterium]MAX94536.1 hypothetical protein [Alphaproteobacteria bacterium]|tara:strand:- start:9407 stop:9877 length:471 start_codon:yes stop_codon:yes gene_type:complete